jgi:hypothetical protein
MREWGPESRKAIRASRREWLFCLGGLYPPTIYLTNIVLSNNHLGCLLTLTADIDAGGRLTDYTDTGDGIVFNGSFVVSIAQYVVNA